MRVKYVPNQQLYHEFYNQTGYGLPVFIGGMRGRGLGSVLSGLFRSAIPLLKKSGKAILREGLSTGLRVAQDVASGKNLKSAVKRRAKGAGERLLKKAVRQFDDTPRPPGIPVKRIQNRKRKRQRSQSSKDIFG